MSTARNYQILDDLQISSATYRLVQVTERAIKAVNYTLASWSARIEDRRQLSQMSDRMLNDIGLSRSDVSGEVEKYFWQS